MPALHSLPLRAGESERLRRAGQGRCQQLLVEGSQGVVVGAERAAGRGGKAGRPGGGHSVEVGWGVPSGVGIEEDRAVRCLYDTASITAT